MDRLFIVMDDVRKDEEWLFLRQHLPADLDVLAKEAGALQRRRRIRSGEDLLRIALVYACDGISLRDVSAWCKESEFLDASDVAVLKRLRSSVPFLRLVVSELLEPVPCVRKPLNLKLLDATTLSRRKAVGTDFRVHVGYDVQTGSVCGIELTDASGGERLDRIPVREDEVIVADMAYNSREILWEVVQQGGHVLVRTHPKLCSVLNSDQEKVNLLGWADGMMPGEIRQLQVTTSPYKKTPSVSGRIIAVLASEKSFQAHVKKLTERARRNGLKVTPFQLDTARYIFLFTTLDPEQASASALLEAYRLRWQIEILFKRIKGILTLGELRAKDKLLCEALILSKLILLLLIQKMEQAFSPWGYSLKQQVETDERLVDAHQVRHLRKKKSEERP